MKEKKGKNIQNITRIKAINNGWTEWYITEEVHYWIKKVWWNWSYFNTYHSFGDDDDNDAFGFVWEVFRSSNGRWWYSQKQAKNKPLRPEVVSAFDSFLLRPEEVLYIKSLSMERVRKKVWPGERKELVGWVLPNNSHASPATATTSSLSKKVPYPAGKLLQFTCA